MSPLPPFATMYKAVEDKDESYLGVFVVAVRSTGVFCRPGCPARTPLAKNVEFFATSSAALHAGYRPCKRCRPMDSGRSAPEWARNLFAVVERDPARRLKNADLSSMGFDPDRARRYFLKNYGMTFQAYSRSRRMGIALKRVREGQDVVTTGMDSGYESDSGFREAFENIIGASPSRNGEVRTLECRWLETPLGPMLACADEAGLCLLEFVDRRMLATQLETLRRRFQAALVPGNSPVLEQTEQELTEYFAGTRRTFEVPLVLKGTPFQETVWNELLRVGYGQTCSYQDIALKLEKPGAVRAVGKANGDNRIAVIVPCHRVIGADGALQGYGGGKWRKQRLLELESGQTRLI